MRIISKVNQYIESGKKIPTSEMCTDDKEDVIKMKYCCISNRNFKYT